jgi:N-succinyldiaminopimelate aminotransferase
MKQANPVLSSYGTTIFEVMSRLAVEHQAINLGQGFPDDRGPADVLEAAAKALTDGWNQYPSMMGLPELRRAVADHAGRFYGLPVDPMSEVMVTSGATEALTACLMGLLEPGDEAVLFQPLYDSYVPIIRHAGGVPRYVTLQPPAWSFTRADLERVFSAKTKLVVINTPQNPCAKVWTRAELTLLAEFLERYDAYAICDEVYEHLVFDGKVHVPLMSLPGMRERCLRIGSAGKTFSLTGWKVGYVTACPKLLQPVAKAHQFLTFTTPPNLQAAVAFGLVKGDDYFTGLASEMQRRRDRLAGGLSAAGLKVLPAEGTYFVIVDLADRLAGLADDDVEFCRRITTEAGVAAIPVSAFYEENAPRHLIRFCFAKQDAVLDGAVERLSTFLGRSA